MTTKWLRALSCHKIKYLFLLFAVFLTLDQGVFGESIRGQDTVAEDAYRVLVEDAYRTELGREADAGGLHNHVQHLLSGKWDIEWTRQILHRSEEGKRFRALKQHLFQMRVAMGVSMLAVLILAFCPRQRLFIRKVFSQIVVYALPVLLSGLLLGAGFQWWSTAVNGRWELIGFLLLAAAVFIAPGLCLHRLLGFSSKHLLDHILMVWLSSGAITSLVIFTLYMCGAYTKTILILWLLIVLAGGIYSFPRYGVPGLWGRYTAWCGRAKIPELLSIAVVGVLIMSRSAQVAGQPFLWWDAVVSWDKWACDMAERHAIGTYLMGSYPQLLPSIHSVFYKITDEWTKSYSSFQILLQATMWMYPVVAALGLIRWLNALGYAWGYGLLFLFAGDLFTGGMLSGYVEWPLLAMISAVGALLASRGSLGWSCGRGIHLEAVPISLGFYAMFFTKAQGLIAGAILFGFSSSLARTRCVPGSIRRITGIGLVCGLFLVAPFYAHQFILDRTGIADRDPRLHSFTISAGYPHLNKIGPKEAGNRYIGNYHGIPARRTYGTGRASQNLISAILLGGCLLWGGTRDKRLWVIAIGAAVLVVVWLHRAAYDWRNVMPAQLLVSLLFGAGIGVLGRDAARCRRELGIIVPASCAILLLGHFVYSVANGTAPLARVFKRSTYTVWTARPERRLGIIDPALERLNNFFDLSTLGQSAASVYIPDPYYRQLGRRGIYSLKPFTFTRLAHGDIALFPKTTMRNSFVPVTSVRQRYATMGVNGLTLSPLSYRIEIAEEMRATDEVGFRGLIYLEPDMYPHFGEVLVLHIETQSPDIWVELDPAWDQLTLDRDLFIPWRQGALNALMIWNNGLPEAPSLPLPLVVHGSNRQVATSDVVNVSGRLVKK